MEHLYSRMIIARYDKKFISAKQLQPTISLLEESLSFRTVSLILRRRFSNPNEICFVCCSSQRINNVDRDLQEEDFLDPDEQHKEIILHEGQILELRFRGNVLPNEYNQQSYQFAYNKNFPFYYQTNVSEIDKYSQHLSPFFYGFVQIFSRKITKDYGKKKQQSDTVRFILLIINEIFSRYISFEISKIDIIAFLFEYHLHKLNKNCDFFHYF